MTVKDAVGGYNKANQWFEKDNNGQPATTGQKVSSVIGGALGGTGPVKPGNLIVKYSRKVLIPAVNPRDEDF